MLDVVIDSGEDSWTIVASEVQALAMVHEVVFWERPRESYCAVLVRALYVDLAASLLKMKLEFLIWHGLVRFHASLPSASGKDLLFVVIPLAQR